MLSAHLGVQKSMNTSIHRRLSRWMVKSSTDLSARQSKYTESEGSHLLTVHCSLSAKPLTRAQWDDSTSNLGRHVTACTKGSTPPAGQQSINTFAQGSTYTPAKFRYKLAVWIARRHCPYAIVQDEEFLELLRMLNSKVEVPHPTTVSRDIREIFTFSRTSIRKILQVSPPLVRRVPCRSLSILTSTSCIQAICTYALTDGPLRT